MRLKRRFFLISLICLALAPAAHAAAPVNKIYWSGHTQNKIQVANLDGSGGSTLTITGSASAVNTPGGTAVDAAAGRVYWINDAGPLSYANLDGSGSANLPTTGAVISSARGLAIDPEGGRIYWANQDTNTLYYANLDGSGGGPISTTGTGTKQSANGVSIDPPNNRIYWTNGSLNTIGYARLDGTGGGGNLNTSGATPNLPFGTTIDPSTGRLYVTNYNAGISYAALSGAGGGNLSITGTAPATPYGAAIDPISNRIYWANLSAPSIGFGSLSGGTGQLLSTTGTNTSGLWIYPALLMAPAGETLPQVSGGTTPGSTLSCTDGTWAADLVEGHQSQAPRGAFAYQWTLDGANVGGATSDTVSATTAGDYRCEVTATNGAGSTVQTSAAHTVVRLADIEVSPMSKDFGAVTIGDTPSQTFTVTNSGGTALNVSSVTLDTKAEFSIASQDCTAQAVAPSGTCSITAKFAPTASGSATDQINITSDASSSPTSIALSGTSQPAPTPTPATGTPPAIAKLTISAKKPRKSTKQLTFGFELSEPATVNMVIQRKYGRKRRNSCKRTNSKTRLDKRCPIYRDEIGQSKSAPAGKSSMTVATSGLMPGAYRVSLTATNSAGTSAPTKAIFFRPWW